MSAQDVLAPRIASNAAKPDAVMGADFPANEVARPGDSNTPLKKSLDADTHPGAIGRSDDAPFIWQELRKHAQQFGQLEKEIATNTRVLEATNRELVVLQCANAGMDARLAGAIDSLKGTVESSARQLTDAISNAATNMDLKAQGRHDPLSVSVGSVQKDVSDALGDISTLKTEQASNKKTLAFLSKFAVAAGTAAAVVFPLIWTFGVHPMLVKNVADAVKAELDKEKQRNARIETLERENAELKAAVAKRR